MAKRRNRRPPGRAQDCLSIRFAGSVGSGKDTVMQAVRLLLNDAGFAVRTLSDGPRGTDHQLIVTPDSASLGELQIWIESEPD